LQNSALEENDIHGILKILDEATPAEYDNGRQWYRRAHRFAAKVAALSGKNPHTVAAVIARLSPQVPWSDNKAAALEICCATDERPACTVCYPDNVIRAEDIAAADNAEVIALEVLPRKGYARPKISAFYTNIADPELDGVATVDTWAIRVWLGDCTGLAHTITAKQSRKIQADYINAARVANLLTHELQAVVWVAAHRLAKQGAQRDLFDTELSFKI